jgi:hypothetical protein
MEMSLLTPAKLILPEENEQVKKMLTFDDQQVKYMLKKLRMNYRWANSDPVGYQARLEALKAEQK